MEDDIDGDALQAQIDLSLSFAQSLAASWVTPSAKNQKQKTGALEAELKEHMRRPPRLGVGADVPAVSTAARDAQKLKSKLSGKRARGEDPDTGNSNDNPDEDDVRGASAKKKARTDPFGDNNKKQKKKALKRARDDDDGASKNSSKRPRVEPGPDQPGTASRTVNETGSKNPFSMSTTTTTTANDEVSPGQRTPPVEPAESAETARKKKKKRRKHQANAGPEGMQLGLHEHAAEPPHTVVSNPPPTAGPTAPIVPLLFLDKPAEEQPEEVQKEAQAQKEEKEEGHADGASLARADTKVYSHWIITTSSKGCRLLHDPKLLLFLKIVAVSPDRKLNEGWSTTCH
ncbi:hypothetical protein MIND_00751300 [Mycena indigotica]|uniref:Uncharacterized protein n=1 Tax=Mycena indigotica TaxID=2126181 RepID=A0A8H6W782_9AGAR|nr:uncharacterized protein MIND_00751300 [Mycena indigotica]KAF7301854.1 hypothetical protein MIND_00751300 [Mycena indigotica]